MTTRQPWPAEPVIVEHSGMCDAGTTRWVVVESNWSVYKRAVHPPCTCGAGLLGLLGLLGAAEVME